MADKPRRWIQTAIKHPGALRKTAGAKPGEPISASKLSDLAGQKGVTGQRARLAQTLRRMHK